MVKGINQKARNVLATEFKGATVKLLSADPADDVTDSTLSNVEGSQTTADADWSISHDNTAGTTTLQNVNSVDFGSTPDFTLDAIVLQSTGNIDRMIIDDEPSGDTDLTGSGSLSFGAGDLTYTFGGQ